MARYSEKRRKEAARKGWETRRKNVERLKRSLAARKGWEKRKAKQAFSLTTKKPARRIPKKTRREVLTKFLAALEKKDSDKFKRFMQTFSLVRMAHHREIDSMWSFAFGSADYGERRYSYDYEENEIEAD